MYLVTGFMRSGTSAFMQGLEAGGMNVLKSDKRDGYNNAHSDNLYKPNPESLFELDCDTLTGRDFLKGQEGKALKLVAPFIDQLPVHEYKVVVLRRDSEEIRQSLEGAFNINRSIEMIEKTMMQLLATLNNRKDIKEIIEVQHQDLMFYPKMVFAKLNWPIDYNKAASVINSDLYRFRKENLVIGL